MVASSSMRTRDALPSLFALSAPAVRPTAGPVADEPNDAEFYNDRAFVAVDALDQDMEPDAVHLTDTFVSEWRRYEADPTDRNYYVFGEPVWWSASLDTLWTEVRGGRTVRHEYTFVNMPAVGPMGTGGHGRDQYGSAMDRLLHTFPGVDEGKTGHFEIATPYPGHVRWFYAMPDLFMDVSFRWQRGSGNSNELADEYYEILNGGAEHKTREKTNGGFRAAYCALVAIDFIEAGKRIRVCGQMFYSAKGDKPPGGGRMFVQGKADPEAHKYALMHLLHKCPYYDLGKEIEGFEPGTRGHAENLRSFKTDFPESS